MVLGAIANGIDSSMYLSVASLLVYRNASDFMYWIYILRHCWIHGSVLASFWRNLWVFHIVYHVICKEWKFDFLLANWMHFIPLCCVITEARTFNTMLNNSGESGHPRHFRDLVGKLSVFSPPRMILVVDLSYIDFMILRYDPFITTLWHVLSRKDAEFCQMLCPHLLTGSCGSSPFFSKQDVSHWFVYGNWVSLASQV